MKSVGFVLLVWIITGTHADYWSPFGKVISIYSSGGAIPTLHYQTTVSDPLTPVIVLSLRRIPIVKYIEPVTISIWTVNTSLPFQDKWVSDDSTPDYVVPALPMTTSPSGRLFSLFINLTATRAVNVTFQAHLAYRLQPYSGGLTRNLSLYESNAFLHDTWTPTEWITTRCDWSPGLVLTTIVQFLKNSSATLSLQTDYTPINVSTPCIAERVWMSDGLRGYYNRSTVACPRSPFQWHMNRALIDYVVVIITYVPIVSRPVDTWLSKKPVLKVRVEWTEDTTPLVPAVSTFRLGKDFLFTTPHLPYGPVAVMSKSTIVRRLAEQGIDPAESGFETFHMMEAGCWLQEFPEQQWNSTVLSTSRSSWLSVQCHGCAHSRPDCWTLLQDDWASWSTCLTTPDTFANVSINSTILIIHETEDHGDVMVIVAIILFCICILLGFVSGCVVCRLYKKQQTVAVESTPLKEAI